MDGLLKNVPMLLKYVPMLRFAGTIERDLTGILLGFRKNPRFINPCLGSRDPYRSLYHLFPFAKGGCNVRS